MITILWGYHLIDQPGSNQELLQQTILGSLFLDAWFVDVKAWQVL